MKIKTGELKDKALDYMVAKIESGIEPEYFNGSVLLCIGGPAVQLEGELDDRNQPYNIRHLFPY